MRKLPFLYFVPLLTLMSCAFGPSSTSVSCAWKAPDYRHTIRTILLIAVTNDESTRENYEREFSRDLSNHGVEVVPSYTVFTSTGLPSKDAVVAQVQRTGADTVLMTRLIDEKDIQKPMGQAFLPGPREYSQYYTRGFDYVFSPAYSTRNRRVALETTIFDATSQDLLWSATSNTTSMGTDESVIDSFIRTIVNKMVQDGIIR